MLLDSSGSLRISNAFSLPGAPGVRLGNTTQILDNGALLLSSANAVSINSSNASVSGSLTTTGKFAVNGTVTQTLNMLAFNLGNWMSASGICLGDYYGVGQYARGVQRMLCSSSYSPAICALSCATALSTFTDMMTLNKAGINACLRQAPSKPVAGCSICNLWADHLHRRPQHHPPTTIMAARLALLMVCGLCPSAQPSPSAAPPLAATWVR